MSQAKIRQAEIALLNAIKKDCYAPASKSRIKYSRVNHMRANCALVALKEITGANDDVLIDAFEKAGMKVNKEGAHPSVIRKAAATLGVKLSSNIYLDREFKAGEGWGGYPTIMDALEQQTGEYLVFTGLYASKSDDYTKANGWEGNGHVYLVRNRKVIDPNTRNKVLKTSLVDFIWKVESK